MTQDHAPSVTVTLLGGLAVRRHGVTVHAPSMRAVELLAYLTVHAEARHPRRHLAALLWPDSDEPQARTNLRRELHHLRSLVPAVCLDITSTSIGWVDDPSCTVDVRTFLLEQSAARGAQQLGDQLAAVLHGRAAIAAYTGALLPGAYDDWVLAERETLANGCVSLCDDVTDALRRKDIATAKDIARRRIQLTPLEETGYQRLMALEVAAGDRAGALTTYHRCASMLEEQLGVSPSAETDQLMRSLLAAPADVIPEAAPDAPAEPTIRTVRADVVGRQADLGSLLQSWRQARAGSPGLVLLTGDPGVGKSTLLRELGRLVTRDGGLVVRTRCFGVSAAALAPVADWLGSHAFEATIATLPGLWKDEVRRLVPDPRSGEPKPQPLPLEHASQRAMADSWRRHRFFEALAHAVTSVDPPLLLILDDFHWADKETASWITFLLHMARDYPVLVVAAARTDEFRRQPALNAELSQLRAVGLIREIEVGPLDLAGTAQLAGRLFGRPLGDAEAQLLHAASGGYPLYVVEASQSSLSRAEPGVTENDLAGVLKRRLSEASPQAQDCAALAAAVGRDFRLELLVEASDLDEASVVAAVDELWRRRLLRQVGHGYDFAHDLLRDTAYQSVPPARRWLEHRRLAQALELLQDGAVHHTSAALAEQYDRGGRPERAIPYLIDAAADAARVYATNDALRLLRRCLELTRALPAGLDREIRELEVLQIMTAPLTSTHGYADRELENTLRRSIALAQALDRTDTEVASIVGLWAATFVQGDIAGSYALADGAQQLVSEVPELAGQVHFGLGGSALSLGRPEESVRHLDLAYDLSIGAVSLLVGTRPEVHARAWSAHAWWLLGDEQRCRDACEQALAGARAADHAYTLTVALAYAAVSYQLLGDVEAVERCAAELATLCHRHGFAYYREWGIILGGWARGDERGITQIQAGIAALKVSRSRTRLPYWLALLAELQIAAGRQVDARASLDAARVSATLRADTWWLPEVLRLRAQLEPVPLSLRLLKESEALALSQSSPGLAARAHTDLDRRIAEPTV